ncbi:MAG TPA: universal stress protein [Microlunatus sp.]|nr:universal stress protein [Microlunatus sp.]
MASQRITRKDIVVGIGDQSSSIGAAGFAVEEAALHGAQVVLVRAVPLPPSSVANFGAQALAELESAAHAVVDGVVAQLSVPPGVHLRTRVECTTPYELLLGLADDASMIVLGQDRLPMADRLLAGSVASPLTAVAGCPIVIVPAGYPATRPDQPAVTVAVDGETSAEQALRLAFDEAELRGTPLVVLHAVPMDTLPTERQDVAASIGELVAGWKADHPDIAVHEVLTTGDPEDVISEQSRNAGLMIVGRPHAKHVGGWSRSIAHAVLKRTACPLVVVPRSARSAEEPRLSRAVHAGTPRT